MIFSEAHGVAVAADTAFHMTSNRYPATSRPGNQLLAITDTCSPNLLSTGFLAHELPVSATQSAISRVLTVSKSLSRAACSESSDSPKCILLAYPYD